MTVTRLSGGLTPADGSDPRTFPGIWNAAADELERGFRLVETVYFTSSGTFTKATYPWLRAIRVKCVGGGGGGGGNTTTGAGQESTSGSGGGGGYSEKFITDIAALDASITVTRGAGGAGGSATNSGNLGATSSFGSIISATGGGGGGAMSATNSSVRVGGGAGGSGTGGDINIDGQGAGTSIVAAGFRLNSSFPGASFLGASRRQLTGDGQNGLLFGSGGTGASSLENTAGRPGGDGSNGIVIVELYA